MKLIYLSHPEVAIDPDVAVPDWGLSAVGQARIEAAALAGWPRGIARIASSDERKARDTARLLAEPLGIEVRIHPGLGEIDRSSTGYVPYERHEELADRLFAAPDISADGWETARAAQGRAMRALAEVMAEGTGDLLIVGHGGVGTLSWCALSGAEIGRNHDQPRGGCVWTAEGVPLRADAGWRLLEEVVAEAG